MDHTATPSDSQARPERRVAGPLTAFLFGPLGYIAIGHWRRACGWYAAEVALGAAVIVAAFFAAPTFLWLALLASMLIRIVMTVDVRRLDRIHPLPRARLVVIVGIGVAVFYGILQMRVRADLVEAFKIPSGSMYPALEVGDHLFVRKTSGNFQRGEVVVFRFPQDHTIDYVKRIVAVGGDVVSIRGDELSINGRPVERRRLEEPCSEESVPVNCSIWEESLDGRRWRVALQGGMPGSHLEPVTVPAGQYFVLGDNRDNSSDSRIWGPVSAELVKGTAEFIWWSASNSKIRWDRINQPVR